MKLPEIEITIDEIVLRGLPAGAQYAFADALEAELTALVRESAVAAATWRSREESSRRVGDVEVSEPSAPALGRAVAATVHAVLAAGRRS